MYCIKCGVELQKSETKCPLCGTVVYHPDFCDPPAPPPYPPYEKPNVKVNKNGALLITTALFVMLILQLLICDHTISGEFSWSLYASGGLALCYIFAILPAWFKRPNPVIFVPVDFAAIALYLLFANLETGGRWFLSFAFPVCGILAGITTAVIALFRYVRRGYFYILGGAVLATGAATLLVEFLLNFTFGISRFYFWSVYPLIGCTLIGISLIIIGICKPLRETLAKKFFI